MKKTILFIGIPLIILIFSVLNAVLLFSPANGLSYKFKEDSVIYSIRIKNDEYFIESKISKTYQLLDYGTAEYKDGKIILNSETSGTSPDIQIQNSFKLKYNENTFYCNTAVVLQVLYALFIIAGFTTLIFTLIKFKN